MELTNGMFALICVLILSASAASLTLLDWHLSRKAAYYKAELEPADNHRAEGAGENEWHMPTDFIEAARDVLGAIDLDPASHSVAQRTVQASKFFTRADDGLPKSGMAARG